MRVRIYFIQNKIKKLIKQLESDKKFKLKVKNTSITVILLFFNALFYSSICTCFFVYIICLITAPRSKFDVHFLSNSCNLI